LEKKNERGGSVQKDGEKVAKKTRIPYGRPLKKGVGGRLTDCPILPEKGKTMYASIKTSKTRSARLQIGSCGKRNNHKQKTKKNKKKKKKTKPKNKKTPNPKHHPPPRTKNPHNPQQNPKKHNNTKKRPQKKNQNKTTSRTQERKNYR